MPNHIHLLIETTEPNLGEGMQRLQSLYAQVFNATYGRSGHLFQGRFGAVRIRTQAQLDAVLDYIALNPVEAGLCGTPEDWPWSSSGARPELVNPGLPGLA
jgi:REP element-mobilizing transposase RayT